MAYFGLVNRRRMTDSDRPLIASMEAKLARVGQQRCISLSAKHSMISRILLLLCSQIHRFDYDFFQQHARLGREATRRC
jgi:hypothetical protein